MESSFTPTVIFEDTTILIIDKPAGMIVNQANTISHSNTVQIWAAQRLIQEFPEYKDKVSESDFYTRAGIVHRLDKETSGLLILAKNEEAFLALQKQFKDGVVSKTYKTLVHGILVEKTGSIDAPIGRLPWNRIRFGILPMGRSSKTEYTVLQEGNLTIGKDKRTVSLIECYPKTGRTHQIRVHMKFIGHPVFGDELYAGRKMGKRDRKILARHFLHAEKIEFTHPQTGERVQFRSVLPEELLAVVQQIQPK
jgi:23S rRNA pseudouridine1911/1915/1917 synthase